MEFNLPFTLEELSEFLVRAKKTAYAGDGREVTSERSGFRELEYSEGDWNYRDSYTQFFMAPGQEVVRFSGEPIWVMSYSGGMNPKLIGDDIRKLISINERKRAPGDFNPEITELIRMLSKRSKPFDIATAYDRSLVSLYEKVRTGQISTWGRLRRNNTSFFDWDVNLRGVVRHVVEDHLLPHYGCTLEDLPQQSKLGIELSRLKINQAIQYGGVRSLLLKAFPEMEHSSHWNLSRWDTWHPSKWDKVSEKERKEYDRFKRKYIFEERLQCRTREDVIAALNDDEQMKAALKAERMNMQVYYAKVNLGIHRKHPVALLEGLEGSMYQVEPWELKYPLPKGIFKNADGSVNRETVGEYLLWVDRNYGFPVDYPLSNEMKNVPHYSRLFLISADKLRDIFTEACKRGNKRE